MSSLLPIAGQGALLYNILCRQLGQSSSQRLQNWQHFSKLYSEAVSLYGKKHPDVVKEVQSRGEGVGAVLKKLVQHLNQTILQDAFRYVRMYVHIMYLFPRKLKCIMAKVQ